MLDETEYRAKWEERRGGQYMEGSTIRGVARSQGLRSMAYI